MPSRRRWIAVALVVLLLHGCSHDGDTLESATATPKPDPIAATVTMRPRPASPATTLHAYLAAITDGEAANAIELLAQDAAWVFNDLELDVGTALPPDLDWLTEALDLSDAATGRDAVQAILSYWVAMRAVPVASECDVDQATATCRYHETDAATEVSGASREGAITVEIVETQIVRLALRIEPASGIVSSASDAFARWAAIEDPTATLDVPTVPMANRVVTLIDTWEAMERPDVPRPTLVMNQSTSLRPGWEPAIAATGPRWWR